MSGSRWLGVDCTDGCIKRALGALRGVAMTHFDGKGGLAQVDHIVIDGVPPLMEWLHGIGTYTVHSDCTGTATITFTDGPFRPPVTFSLAGSLGGVESLATIPAATTHARLSKEERTAMGVSDGLVRLSVGKEAVEDLISDIDQALVKTAAARPVRSVAV